MKHWVILLALRIAAQQTIAPTDEPVGIARGEDWLGYNIRQSFEAGARFLSVDGSRDKYRSDVNYRNGVRLLSSKLDIHSRQGKGKWFDEIVLNTLGLGNDPYQFTSLRIEKNRWYRYDMGWRQNEYFNPGLAIVDGLHRQDTLRRLQDHTLTIRPGQKWRVLGGYSRNSQFGAALTTTNLFDLHAGAEFPLFSDVSRRQDEFRLGAEAEFLGFRLSAMRTWENFRDDTADSAGRSTAATGATALTRLTRTQPYTGDSNGWRASLFTDRKRWYAMNGRFTYVDGRRSFLFDETALGTDRFGAARDRQLVVGGNARRPLLAANYTLSILPTARLTVTNHTSLTDTRMEGNSLYTEFNNRTRDFSFRLLDFLGIRMVTNTTDALYQATRWLSFHGGYHFGERRIRSNQDGDRAEQTNTLHAGQFGVRVRGWKNISLNLDGEIGRADNPFYPTSDGRYHGLNARLEYKRKNFRAMVQARSNDNFNSVSLWSHSARTRQYSGDVSYTGLSWLSLDAGYSKLHVTTLTGLAYFVDFEPFERDRSLYVSNLHTIYMGVHSSIRRKADVYAGWSRISDQGGTGLPVLLRGLALAQSFPFLYHSPMFRLSVPLRRNIRWNAGYQFYGYGERRLAVQNYRANTAYSSLLWSF